jgi:nucleoside-diphosphate-sugar epimerase
MKALVTGGGGFLGGAICRMLLARGDTVRSFTRSNYPWLDDIGIEQRLGDLGDVAGVTEAVRGCDVVFHVAAKAGVWGRTADFVQTNQVGTANVIAACRSAGVDRLVYTSTPSVVHGGASIEGGNESLPYPDHFEADYPRSKALAEKQVLAANGPELATVSLRPHLIWGPGDPHLIPRLLDRARRGKLRRIGTDRVLVDVTYVENAAHAHLLAADRLSPQSTIAGKAYFLSDGTPVDLWEFVNRILAAGGVAPVTRSVAKWKAKLAGRLLEFVYRTFRLNGEPAMTRFVASQLATSHWYDISAARRDLGYEPVVGLEEGLKRLTASLTGDRSRF